MVIVRVYGPAPDRTELIPVPLANLRVTPSVIAALLAVGVTPSSTVHEVKPPGNAYHPFVPPPFVPY